MTKQNAIKKHLAEVKKDLDESTTKEERATASALLALLENIGRDLLTVEQFEKVFGVDLIQK